MANQDEERHPGMGFRVFMDQHLNTFQSFIDSPRTMLPHALQVTKRSAIRQELRSRIQGKDIEYSTPESFNDHNHVAHHGNQNEMTGSEFAARVAVLPRRKRHHYIEGRRANVLRYQSPFKDSSE